MGFKSTRSGLICKLETMSPILEKGWEDAVSQFHKVLGEKQIPPGAAIICPSPPPRAVMRNLNAIVLCTHSPSGSERTQYTN